MLYRVAGQYKTSYKADYALFPVKQDAWLLGIILLVCFVILPLMANEFAFRALLIPVLIYSLAALGLNILTDMRGSFRWAPVPSWGSEPMPAISSRPFSRT